MSEFKDYPTQEPYRDEFNKAKVADYLADDIGLSVKMRTKIELRQDVNFIYVLFKDVGKVRRFAVGGVSPRFMLQEIQKELSKN